MPEEADSDPQLVGFHLLIPMGCVESSPFFCTATKMVKYRVIKTLYTRWAVLGHPLETLAEVIPPDRDARQESQEVKVDDTWSKLNTNARQVALAPTDVYLDEFIGVIQGGPMQKT